MRNKFIPKSKEFIKTKNDYYDFEIIATNLKQGSKEVNSKDETCFKQYTKGLIALEECLEKFKKNNGTRVNIKADLFRRWLESLGWVKE